MYGSAVLRFVWRCIGIFPELRTLVFGIRLRVQPYLYLVILPRDLNAFSTKERARFWSYAKGSVGELRTQIHIGHEIGYITEEKAGRCLSESEQLSRMLAAMIKGIQHG